MDRFFLAGATWAEPLFLSGEEAHHCTRVMRKRVGEVIEVFDGQGRATRAEILEAGKSRVELNRIEEVRLSAQPSPEISLAVGIPKGKTMDLIIQKAVELGVTRIQPLICEQGMVKAAPGDKKGEKWQRVALEACKQCGQNFLPEVYEPLSVSDFLNQNNDAGLAIVAALRPGSCLFEKVFCEHQLNKVTLLIGPEGDFSVKEYEAAFSAGFIPVDLGDLVLRVETAAIYAISVIRHEGTRKRSRDN